MKRKRIVCIALFLMLVVPLASLAGAVTITIDDIEITVTDGIRVGIEMRNTGNTSTDIDFEILNRKSFIRGNTTLDQGMPFSSSFRPKRLSRFTITFTLDNQTRVFVGYHMFIFTRVVGTIWT